VKKLTAIGLVLGFAVVLLGLTQWRPGAGKPWSDDAAPLAATESQPPPAAPHAAPVTAAAQRPIKRPYLVRPAELFVSADEQAVRAYRAQQAKELFGTVRRKLNMVRIMSPDPNPESLTVQVAEYLEGWTDGVVRGAPDLVDDFANEVQETLCARDPDPALLLVTFRMITSMPELGSAEAFDCIFSERTTEDNVLWSALDAWRASGLPKSEALAALERRVTDSRTRERFLPRRGRGPHATSESEAVETMTSIKGDQPLNDCP